MDPQTPATIEPPANVLLVRPKHGASTACDDLCRESGPTAELRVSFADDRPDAPDPDDVEGKVGFLTVGNVLDGEHGASSFDFSQPVVTDSVCDPTDLSAIGVAISRFCKHWADADERIVVCFDSLDALIHYTSPKTVFQFAHVLTTRLATVDAYAHFHFDPSRYDDPVVSTFGTIFDAVVVDGDADPLPEATDEEVASLLEAWVDDPDPVPDPDPDRDEDATLEPKPTAEATDEDIARILGE